MANNNIINIQPESFGRIDRSKNYLDEELWKLCSGSLCDFPKLGEKVYYFPQGHIEHIETSTKEYMDHMKPFVDIPSKLQCYVIDIKLQVEKDTEEVYAQITLSPDRKNTTQVEIPIHDDNQQRRKFNSFTKILTESDVSTHGGLSVLRRHATECLPALDMSMPTPTQEIRAKDLHDNEWRFKHIFRGTPRRHLFTTGWSAFATTKRLVVGDSIIFLRGENGEARVAIKRVFHQQSNIPSIISTQNVYDGVIASTFNAIKANCMFTVSYKPRLCQFVVSYKKFVEAMNKNFTVGSKFKMQFEDEHFTKKWYIGTIVAISDASSHWKSSEWRTLQVHWDEPASFPRPNKVSQWNIEYWKTSSISSQYVWLNNKRTKQINEIGSISSNLWIPTLNQSQEIGQSSKDYVISVPQHFHCDAYDYSNNNQMTLPMKKRITFDATTSCRLFGINLTTSNQTRDPVESTNSYIHSEISKLVEEKKFDITQTLTSSKEVQNKKNNSVRNLTKVEMQGVSISKYVDLDVFDGYNQLIDDLEKLFSLKGELKTSDQWEILFIDDEEDIMLLEDYMWPEFYNMVKKIFICSKEEVKKMKSINKFIKGKLF